MFVTNWISTTKIQKISEITNFFRHYFLSRTEVGYYHLANMKRFLMETDEWLRRRLRMCIWKSWKRVKTRIANLIKCGIDKYQAYMWGNSRLGYWRIAGSYILCRAITNEKLSMAGYATLMGSYLEWHPK